jgi:type I restriction enzyme M protein
MLDTQTKKRIDDCRDILVGKLPDPKAQIEQITIGLIYKFMDDMDKEAIELGGQAKFFSGDYEKYAWDKLFDTKVTAAEMLRLYSTAIESMEKNPNIPPLFRDIFNNAYLPYRDPETLKLFLKTIGEFAYTHSEKLGDAFEYLLSVMGSQGDAGQFRTPRHIIDFLVAIVDPDKGQSILDPACGTAGFLISAYKHILLKHTKANKEGLNIYAYNKLEKKPFNDLGGQLTPDERKKLNRHFAGYDISPDMVRLSLVNLYLHGFPDPAINEYDTLSSEERWNENYDVILANPPFMSPKGGIRPHKKFTISSNRSEVLFVDYIAEHLNPRGKAGIIVPEGVIFQSGTAYKELRKMLVDNYLYAVVSLPAGVFNPYSGVKTSILLMDKEVSKKRDEILFVKIDNDGYNLGAQRTAVKGSQLEEAIALAHAFVATGEFPDSLIAHTVLKAEIAANGEYNLSGSRYLAASKLETNFRIAKLEDVIEYEQPTKYIVASEEYDDSYKTPVLTAGKSFILGYTNEDTGIFDSPLPVIIFDDFTTATKLVDFRFKVKSSAMKILKAKENANITFLYYLMQHIQFDSSDHKRYWISQYSKIQIPLPPISIQEEIVAEIEGYQKIIDGAKAVVANYKPIIEIDPDWEMVELGCLAKNLDGKRVPITKSDREEGVYPYYGASGIVDFVDDFIFNEDLLLISEDGANLRARVTPIAFSVSGKIWVNNHAHVLRFDKIETQKFVELFINSISLEPFITGSAQPKLNQKALNSIPIPLPGIETQRQIVAQIEKEQELVHANKQLIEIFEQKIKDRIARVWGVADRPGASTEQADEDVPLSMAAEPGDKYLKH